jgi:tetratricopeptide (TPR) repeat protein
LAVFILNYKALTNVSYRNQLSYEAEKAVKKEEYGKALGLYKDLCTASYIISPSLRNNLATAYFMTNDTANARREFLKVVKINHSEISSSALISLGQIDLLAKDSTSALLNFRKALEQNEDSKVAQQYYEWLRRSLPMRQQRLYEKQIASQTEVEKDVNQNPLPPQTNLNEEQTLFQLNAMRMSDVEHLSKQKRVAKTRMAKDL